MPSLYSTLVSSLAALFSVSTSAPRPVSPSTLEEVRHDMLGLAGSCSGPAAASLQRRIRFAADVQDLWFMRSELMARLATTFGETEAREKVAALGVRFEGLLPSGLKARPSFLDSGGHSQWGGPPPK